jgi:hypothetical protein
LPRLSTPPLAAQGKPSGCLARADEQAYENTVR